MKISRYLRLILKDFFQAYGFLTIITLLFLTINSRQTISISLLGQIVLFTSAYVLFKFAFVNKYDLGKKAQLINFMTCSTLADLIIVFWLLCLSPGRIFDKDLLIAFIVVILVVKGMVYAMMYVDGRKEAEQINEKLIEYRNREMNK